MRPSPSSTPQKRGRRRPAWPNVYTRRHRSGQVSYVVDLGLVGGTRARQSFKTREEALTHAEQARIARINEGVAAFALPPDIRAEAAKAHALLAPHGVSILQAAEHFLKHVIAYRTAPVVKKVIEQMLAQTRANGRRDRTLRDLAGRLGLFAEDFGERRLSEIAIEELTDWVCDDDWSARSRIHYLTKISQLYNFAIKHSWADTNPVEKINRPAVEDKEPGILTIDQAALLLGKANDFGLLPYIAIGLFAGLRSAELVRLDAAALNPQERSIVVGAHVAKKRSRRVIEMPDALVAWLGHAKIEPGPIVAGDTLRDRMDALKAAANIDAWPHNALRHLFASYHLAFHGDAMRTATILGHKDASVVHNHYKALVQRSEAARFWELRPGDRQEHRGS